MFQSFPVNWWVDVLVNNQLTAHIGFSLAKPRKHSRRHIHFGKNLTIDAASAPSPRVEAIQPDTSESKGATPLSANGKSHGPPPHWLGLVSLCTILGSVGEVQASMFPSPKAPMVAGKGQNKFLSRKYIKPLLLDCLYPRVRRCLRCFSTFFMAAVGFWVVTAI